ncbi:hypothetical protein [Acinetobacter nosocomialis]|uniref:hypothetical protein n=1 Tax=Acinetobacter nosocomialis TaxID=106654 RepID=UPI00148F3660|nr:hypothetical protein [Acinetobacter nosocomialis]
MNAKINIQLPGQSVPFYNASNLLNAYKLAYETANQLLMCAEKTGGFNLVN